MKFARLLGTFRAVCLAESTVLGQQQLWASASDAVKDLLQIKQLSEHWSLGNSR